MNDLREAPVGVFDSGIGGLTVAREIMRQIPGERIVYFGDTARVPYGSKSGKTIIRYSCQIARFLQTRGVKVIVVACNTGQRLRPGGIAAAGGYSGHRRGASGSPCGGQRECRWQYRCD